MVVEKRGADAGTGYMPPSREGEAKMVLAQHV